MHDKFIAYFQALTGQLKSELGSYHTTPLTITRLDRPIIRLRQSFPVLE